MIFKRISIFIILLTSLTGFGQINDHFVKKNKNDRFQAPNYRSTEMGVFLGVSQYNGELNRASQFNPVFIKPAFGGVIRRNLGNRWAIRLNAMYGKLIGNDNYGNTKIQERRGLAFESALYEGSLQFEFNFIPYCAADQKQYVTPFIFGGGGASYVNPSNTYVGESSSIEGGGTDAGSGSNIIMNVPMGAGVKVKFSHRLLMSLEWGMRKTTSDYIDGVSTVYASNTRQLGNSKNNDWYSFAGVALTVRVGHKLTSCERFGNKRDL